MTIYALSTGPGVSGIAIIRVSGSETAQVIKTLTGRKLPEARVATHRKLLMVFIELSNLSNRIVSNIIVSICIDSYRIVSNRIESYRI